MPYTSFYNRTLSKSLLHRRVKIDQPSNAKNPFELLTTTPDFTPNKYIRLEKTDLGNDAGQTTVPVLDALEVSAKPAIPLVGVNLFHKRADGFGGYLSMQIETVDRSAYIELADRSMDNSEE